MQCEKELQSLKSSLQSKELALKNAQMTTEEQLKKQYEKLSQVHHPPQLYECELFGS